MIIPALFLILLIVLLLPFVLQYVRKETLTDDIRKRLSNKTSVRLSDGITHCEWLGPEEGRKVVLIHGFSSPMFIWDKNAHVLAAAGFRVLRYDEYGRGYSDRPRVRYTADLFVRQLIELLDAFGVHEPVDLVGLSMGGAIAVHVADRHPDRVRKLVLLAPAAFNPPPAGRVVTLPLLGEWLMAALGERIIFKSFPRMLGNDRDVLSAFREEYARQFHFRGCLRAFLSTMRHGPVFHMGDVYQRVGRQQRSGLLLWGDKDNVLPYPLHKPVLKAMPWLKFETIPGAGHCLNYQNPEAVNRCILDWLSRD